MAKVLVLELDPVFAAVIEDRLIVSGHESTWVQDPAVAVSAATEGRADLLIMSMELPGVSGLEIVRQLKQQTETRSLPIVALSASSESADRIAALRAGVDDFITTPCDPEELVLRLARLLGGQGPSPPVLRGDLASHPTWELLQVIQQGAKSGDLMLHGKKGSGRIRFDRGQVLSARWEKLRGRDALLAIAEMKEGRFQQTTEAPGTAALPEDALRIQDVLIQAAWIEDELAKRRGHLPSTGTPLECVSANLPETAEPFRFLPIERVFERIKQTSGVRIYELMTDGKEAPSKVRLAVAWLTEQGVVAPKEQTLEASPMSTSEISSSVVIDVAVHNLLSTARNAGFDVSALPYLLLAESGVWPELQQLPARVPGFLRIEALRKLVERTQDGHGGSTSFATDLGKLSLHVQPLSAKTRQQVEAIVPVCAGVLVWMDQAEDAELVGRVVERLEAARGRAVGMLVATSPAAAEAAAELTRDTTKWKTSGHAPRSLLGVLRLLQPRNE
ncbi:MAG: response regulator [Acidobacteriota bacterium]